MRRLYGERDSVDLLCRARGFPDGSVSRAKAFGPASIGIAFLRPDRKHIALAAAGVDEARGTGSIQLGAQALDIDIDDVGEGVEALFPDVLRNVLAPDHA